MKMWYKRCRAEIEKLYGGDADLFCDLLAACSPRKHIKANWKMAVRIYESRNSDNINYTGCLPCHRGNIDRVLSGQELSGRKVRAFAACLKGDLNQVVVDVWVARFFGFEKITDKVYDMCIDIIRAAAGFARMYPAEVQAQVWIESLQLAGRKPLSFCSAIDRQMKFWKD